MISRDVTTVSIRHNWNAGRTQPWILSGKRVDTVSGPQQIGPGRKENCAGRHRQPFIPQSLQKR